MEFPQRRWLIFAFLPVFATGLCRANPVTATQPFRSWQVYKGGVTSLAFSPDGKVLASAGDEKVLLWDAQSGRLLRQVTQYVGDVPWVIAFTPDSKHLLCVTFDGQLQLHDLTSGKVLWTRKHDGMVHTMALAPDGKTYAVGSGGPDNLVGVLEIGSISGKRTRILRSEDPVLSVGFSPDSQMLAAGSMSKITLWNVASREVVQTVNTDFACAVTFAPRGKLFAATNTGGEDTILLWEMETRKFGEPRRVPTGHQAWLDLLVFSPDGRTLASGSTPVSTDTKVVHDETVKLWNPQTGGEQRTLRIGNEPGKTDNGPNAIAFSPDSKILAVGTGKGEIMLWETE